MSASATSVFCPPLSCFMLCVSLPPKATFTLTPLYFSSAPPLLPPAACSEEKKEGGAGRQAKRGKLS